MTESQKQLDWLAAEQMARSQFEQNLLMGMERGRATIEAARSAQALLDQSASRGEQFGTQLDRLRAELFNTVGAGTK